jgi:hypothetical protein
MSDFTFYFQLGWHHIISWDALDHILFIVALAAIYLVRDWKQVLVLVTAFTIGHSITLALSVYSLVKINDQLVETLIPVTIIATAVFNFFHDDYKPKSLQLNYFLALFFGLIHGLGFANTIRFMLAKDEKIGWGLFGFNVGLEAGQIAVVSVILLSSFLVVNMLKLSRKHWVFGLSGIALFIGIKMLAERFF